MLSSRGAAVAAVTALALLPSVAEAAPPPAQLALPLAVGTFQDQSLGLSKLSVSYTWDTASATASAPAITLANGERFRIYTCIQTHVYGRSFATKCAQKDVDTRSKALPTVVAGPSVTATTPRPATGAWGYAYHQIVVQKQKNDGSYGYSAGTSLAGLAKAAVPLPPEGAWVGTLPSSQGVTYPGSGVGGLNSGAPDSMCVGSFKSGTPPAGVSNTALGTGAPAYYEVGQPTTGTAAKGVMLVIHGGAWNANGPGSVAGMRKDADRWRARGWRTVSISYRPCELAFGDVKWFYDRARTVYGATLPYCALGASAGGNLALLLAAQRPSLSCVINQSGPTNAETLPDQQAYDPATGSSVVGPRWTFNMLTAAVGQENTHWYSPALFSIKARVLSAFTEHDPLIPFEQATELQSKMLARDPAAYSDVVKLGAGTATTFVHAQVSQAALDEYYEREQQLVAPLVGQ